MTETKQKKMTETESSFEPIPLLENFPKVQKAMYDTTVLIAGAAGAGKSLFSMQYLMEQIIENDIPGIYISFEESQENLIKDFRAFKNWNIDRWIKSNWFMIIDTISRTDLTERSTEEILRTQNISMEIPERENQERDHPNIVEVKLYKYRPIREILQFLLKEVVEPFLKKERKKDRDNDNQNNAKIKPSKCVIVLDSITALLDREVISNFENDNGKKLMVSIESKVRETMIWVKTVLEKEGYTILLPAEADIRGNLRFGNEDFISRGVFELNFEEQNGELIKYFRVKKMRGAGFSTEKFLTVIDSKNGFQISGAIL